MKLHALDYPHNEIEIDPSTVEDIRFASFAGGSLIDLAEKGTVAVDENPNYVSLLAGFIHGDHCATGSRSGTRDFYVDHPFYLSSRGKDVKRD